VSALSADAQVVLNVSSSKMLVFLDADP